LPIRLPFLSTAPGPQAGERANLAPFTYVGAFQMAESADDRLVGNGHARAEHDVRLNHYVAAQAACPS
jgi:hypothetical protein